MLSQLRPRAHALLHATASSAFSTQAICTLPQVLRCSWRKQRPQQQRYQFPSRPIVLQRSYSAQAATTKGSSTSKVSTPTYEARSTGEPDTLDYRVWLYEVGSNGGSAKRVSAWHDIPLLSGPTSNSGHSNDGTAASFPLYNFINEIPRGTRAKFEISTTAADSPIAQDKVKSGALRYFKYGQMPFNYGALPQTWEDPTRTHTRTGARGDDDPIDVVELSPDPLAVGSVTPVRVFGVLGLLDEGETDWKLLALRADHPLLQHMRGPEDAERLAAGALGLIRDWFRLYKTADGKPENALVPFDERGTLFGCAKEAQEIIDEAHHSWRLLLAGKKPECQLWLPSYAHGKKSTAGIAAAEPKP